jgi:hypothetical protein
MASGRDVYRLTKMVTKYVNSNTNTAMSSAVAQVQEALARRTDENVRLERQRRRLESKRVWASRWATAWAIISVIAVLYVVLSFAQVTAVITGTGMALASGALAIRSTRRMVLLKRARQEFDRQHPPAGVAPPKPTIPPKGSAAREPMKNLAEAEAALSQVLAQLAGSESVPVESVAQAEATSAEAAAALRAVAAQLVAVELARDHAPPLERGPLVEGVNRLRTQLDEGMTGYRSLVAAAGRVVAASTAPGPKQELTEATDHLAGLAIALRDLSTPT